MTKRDRLAVLLRSGPVTLAQLARWMGSSEIAVQSLMGDMRATHQIRRERRDGVTKYWIDRHAARIPGLLVG